MSISPQIQQFPHGFVPFSHDDVTGASRRDVNGAQE